MAVTVTTDLVVRHSMDAITNTGGIGGLSAPNATDTNIKVQGTASSKPPSVNAGLGGISGSFTAANFKNLHIMCWVNDLDKADTIANGGWRIRVASSLANMTTNFGEWTVGGQAEYIAPINGFQRWCIDVDRPFDFITGTLPALSSIAAIAVVNNHLTNSSRDTWFSDSYDSATGITIGGGGVGTEGNSSQIAANDLSTGHGLFKNVGGAYYVLGRVTIGNTAASSEFADSNEVWVFENQRVAATFHKIEFVGDAGAGVNNAKFGTKSGTGVATEAAGGNTFKATGLSPFRVHALDSNIAVGLYGCSFTNPIALKDDALRAFQSATAALVYTDRTVAANNTTANDMLFMQATEAVGDFCVFGHAEPFSQIKINIGTAGTVGAVAWEYWDGTAWTALTDVTDGTTGLTTAGTNTVTYSIPPNWATQTLNGLGAYYYIRARVTTVYTVNPLGTQAFAVMGGDVRLEQANAEAIRSTFTNMDTIRIRNGAFIKKCTITNSVAPAKSAALDLGATDPAADTVRDMTIQNCSKGILLQKIAVGNVTYNFRNIKFSGNTTDVRVDFPTASTVTINVLEGGSTPTIDNVNGSTVVVNNTVVVKVTTKDAVTGAVLQNARVLLEAAAGGDLAVGTDIVAGLTDASGIIQNTGFNFTNPQPVTGKARKSTTSPLYKSTPISGTITSSGLDLTLLMIPDE